MPEPTDRWARERAELDGLAARSLRRSVLSPEGLPGREVVIDGRSLLQFTSNNYLGLAGDPRLIEAAVEATRRSGTSVSASRLLAGSTPEHDRLEQRLAALKRRERALLFSSGYLANLGLITALSEPGDVVFSDELNHASIIDACRLARSKSVVYRHADLAHLEQLLGETAANRRLIVTETVFSMDGDIAPLPELIALAERFDAVLVLDEAHATGVLGLDGAGGLSHFGIADAPAVIIGTLSKALGSVGAFVAADATVVEYLLNRSRPFIFNTALPPAAVGAAHAALDIAAAEPERRQRLARLAERFRTGLNTAGYETDPSHTQIVPMLIGEPAATVAMEQRLRAAGVLAKAVRPPTVPPGTSRIRFNLSAAHEDADVEHVLAAVPLAHATQPAAPLPE